MEMNVVFVDGDQEVSVAADAGDWEWASCYVAGGESVGGVCEYFVGGCLCWRRRSFGFRRIFTLSYEFYVAL